MKAGFDPGPYAEAFTNAEAYLAKGRDKNDRPISANTRLRRIDADTIAVVLHTTAVVTYHRDTTMTIYGGGWDSVTTKRRIRDFSPARVHSHNGSWIIGYTDEVTPPRLRKCRTCKHRGTWTEIDYCQGPRRWGRTWCQGKKWVRDVPYDPDLGNWDAHFASARAEPCEHGHDNDHATEPCSHGEWKRHATGVSTRSCHRCAGTGTADYGSQRVPILGGAWMPYNVNAAGDLLGFPVDKPTPGKSKTYAGPEYVYTPPPAATPHEYGPEVADRIAARMPGLVAEVMNPALGIVQPVRTCIISLNDQFRWPREQIADWLDTLDVDLRFPATT